MNGSVHWRTPSVSVTGPRGQVVRQVEYLRTVLGAEVQALVSRQQHDVAGRPIAQWDPRLSIPNTTTLHGLSGQPLRVVNVDAGASVNLPGLAGQPVQTWDAHGNHRQLSHDDQLRLVAIAENAVPGIETSTYGDLTADPGHNLRGQMLTLTDPSGRLDFPGFSVHGQPLSEVRTVGGGITFTSQRKLSASGALLEQTDARGHRQQSLYDLAGQLKHVQLLINGELTWLAILQDAKYNAAGQIIEQLAGNDVLSSWQYTAADGRLHRHFAQKAAQPRLQDFEYKYDRAGNITRILDHVYTPRFFSNQRVDGDRSFTYDSLYRLLSATGHDDAPPSDIPGRPQPTDPADRLNYTQTYVYDHGGNLIEICHVRDGANRTVQTCIDPASNRGVRWKTGDPVPDFKTLFDPAGNLLALQPGQPLKWNARNQLESVVLVNRDGADDDAESYQYSQGSRVYKRHATYAKVDDVHEVRYLPGLEIRTSNAEELHVISLAAGSGNVRCLHWVTGKPAEIPDNQLRFTLEDHLGSSVMELDQQARQISHEGYYPFGATAWLAPGSALEVSYKSVRYSGKEMDVSGLYYYGARYYAPWLGRWISADPAGPVDGLNLYAFVGNNPVIHVDKTGNAKALFDIAKGFIGVLDKAKTAADQLHNLANEFDGLVPEGADINALRESMTFGTFMKSRHGIKSALYGAIKGAGVGGLLGTAVPGIGNLIGTGVGAVVGAVAFPLLRYYFFKKSLKAVQTLRTREIAATVTGAADSAAQLVKGAQSLINGGSELLEKIKSATDNLAAYPQRLQDMFYRQLDELVGDQQREVMKLLKTGLDPFDAIEQALSTVQQLKESPSEAEGVTARLEQLAQRVSAESLKKPTPKPRTKVPQQLHRTMSETYV